MSRIFISYRRTDSGGHAGRIFDRLRDQFGAQDVFFDQDAIEPGDHFPHRIEAAIRSAGVVLVVIGSDWLESLNTRAEDDKIDFVQREVSTAVERKGTADDQIGVIPILVGGATMPERDRLHDNLRDSIGPLFDYQALTFQGGQQDRDQQFKQLFARIEAVLGIVHSESSARFGEPPVVSIQAPTVGSPTPDSARAITLPQIDIDNVERAFHSVSRMLLEWPQEIDGHWIERPELPRLHELTTSRSSSVTILLGGPGEGKSAILARLGLLLAQDGTVLLAMKADHVPREVASLRQLDDWIDCGVELATALRRLAKKRRVVVLIDQLDALGELMDQHSGRLSALLRLVDTIRDTPNLQVIVSCREFEFRYDVRLNTLRAEEVTLAPLRWDQVLPVLNARKIDTDRWSDDVRAVLCTPHNLAIYLKLLAQDVPAPDFTSYQALLDRVIRERVERVYGYPTVHAAERIAAEMAAEEELSLARARFPDLGTKLESLEAAGLLVSSEDGLRVSFEHQTVFDVLRARSFLRDGASLADYVVHQKQQSLFVRPALWSALNYLRASDTPTYRNEFRRLWRDPGLRLHLRYLLIAFLGQVEAPTDQEAGWLFSKLHAPHTRQRVLSAMARSAAAWFPRMSDRLPQLMAEPPRRAWATVSFLAGAIIQHRDSVLGLIERQWMTQTAYLEHATHALCESRSWDTDSLSVAIACVDRIVDHTPNDTFMIQRLMDAIAGTSPGLALKLLAHYLQVRTERVAGTQSDDESERDQFGSKSQGYERFFRDTIWYKVSDLFDRHPRALMEHVWPWFIRWFEYLGKEDRSYHNAYCGHDGLSFSGPASESDFLQKAIEQAIRKFSEDDPDAFLGFVTDNAGSDLNVVHRLLTLGLERIAARRPQAVLHYLLGDRRRLAIADVWYKDDVSRSIAVIAATSPSLGNEDVRRLESAIVSWQYYSHDLNDYEAKDRLELKRFTRMRRLPLLSAVPLERLSPAGQRLLQEEKRAFPDTPYSDLSTLRMRRVDSPMSAEQMKRASDEEIVRLFQMLTDDTEWHHPTRDRSDLIGGSIQAAREFAKLAKVAPDRALQIIGNFEPGKAERPAGEALAALGASDVTAGKLIEKIRNLDGRGFASTSFRIDAARCLREVARRSHGLDDDMCDLLEGWITERPSTLEESAAGLDDTVTTNDSIPWSSLGFSALPQGNYTFLDALMLGRLLRNPPDLSGWLGVLERHLKRDEEVRVWIALTRDMPHLVSAGGGRGIKFLAVLFVRYPTLLNTKSGVQLIGHIVERLPDGLTNRIVDTWVSGDWTHGPQAAGEIAALNLFRKPDSGVARGRVDHFLKGDNLDPSTIERLRVGLTYTFAKAWHHVESRPLSTQLLIRLIDTARGTVAAALHSVFQKSSPLPVDAHTRELLEALLKRPSMLVAQNVYFLVESMKGLVYEEGYPVLVYDVSRTLIEQAIQTQSESEAVQSLALLADLALTLHRIPETRERGLDLFERLLKADVPGLSEPLKTIDRPAFR